MRLVSKETTSTYTINFTESELIFIGILSYINETTSSELRVWKKLEGITGVEIRKVKSSNDFKIVKDSIGAN